MSYLLKSSYPTKNVKISVKCLNKDFSSGKILSFSLFRKTTNFKGFFVMFSIEKTIE